MLDLEHYRPTPLESFVVDFYRKRGIRSPQDIDLEMLAYEAGIWIHYADAPTTHYEIDDGKAYSIVVDNGQPWEQQRVELAHELGHCLLHVGRQDLMPIDFRVRQEWQADRFAAYALAPTFMIANCWVDTSSRERMVSQLAYQFDVPEPFMDARLRLLEERLHTLAFERQMAQIIAAERAMYDYSFCHPTNPRIEYLVRDNRVIHARLRADI